MQGSSAAGSTASSAQHLSGLPLDGSVVKLRGLPFRASVEDVLRFFTSFPELSTGNIYFKRHPDGRPSGEVRTGTFIRVSLVHLGYGFGLHRTLFVSATDTVSLFVRLLWWAAFLPSCILHACFMHPMLCSLEVRTAHVPDFIFPVNHSAATFIVAQCACALHAAVSCSLCLPMCCLCRPSSCLSPRRMRSVPARKTGRHLETSLGTAT